MPDFGKVAAAVEDWSEITTKTDNTTCTATRAAVTGQAHYITSVSVSVSGTALAAVTVEVRSGATVKRRYELPATAWGVQAFNFRVPIRCAAGEAASVVLPALGASLTYTAQVGGFTSTP